MSRSISDDDKKAIVEAVIEGLAKSNRTENHDQLRSMFRLEAALAKATEELARKDAVIADLQTRNTQLAGILVPSTSPTAPPPPFVPPITYQVPMYPGSTVTAPVPPPVTTYSEYQFPAIPSQNGHSAE